MLFLSFRMCQPYTDTFYIIIFHSGPAFSFAPRASISEEWGANGPPQEDGWVAFCGWDLESKEPRMRRGDSPTPGDNSFLVTPISHCLQSPQNGY